MTRKNMFAKWLKARIDYADAQVQSWEAEVEELRLALREHNAGEEISGALVEEFAKDHPPKKRKKS